MTTTLTATQPDYYAIANFIVRRYLPAVMEEAGLTEAEYVQIAIDEDRTEDEIKAKRDYYRRHMAFRREAREARRDPLLGSRLDLYPAERWIARIQRAFERIDPSDPVVHLFISASNIVNADAVEYEPETITILLNDLLDDEIGWFPSDATSERFRNRLIKAAKKAGYAVDEGE